MVESAWHRLEVRGGRVRPTLEGGWQLQPGLVTQGYTNAQIDDYSGRPRRSYPWRPGVALTVRARFSHPASMLRGTAGFGFWNAPFGDPDAPWPALPQAVWFFLASPPTDLPLAPAGPGRGWFVSTLDAARPAAWSLAPLAPGVLLANRWSRWRRRVWPWVQRRLGISFAPVNFSLTGWRTYTLLWGRDGCRAWVDGALVLTTPHTPHGPLGCVMWMDNQYLALTPTGRLRAGVLPIVEPQWLEIADWRLQPEEAVAI